MRRIRSWLVVLFLAATWTARGATVSVLYLFAHQDDEVFALQKMRLDLERGRNVVAVWITDGAKEGGAAERERESRAVMRLVGVPDANLRFLGFPDHGSIRRLPEIFGRLRALQAEFGFTELTSPAYEGGNIDHDATAFLAAMLGRDARTPMRHVEFPLYNHRNGHRQVGVFLPNSPAPIERVALPPEARQLVARCLKLYHSQRLLITLLELTGHRKKLLEEGEVFRPVVAYDYRARPLDEKCGYEVSGLHRATFAEWLAGMDAFAARFPELAAPRSAAAGPPP